MKEVIKNIVRDRFYISLSVAAFLLVWMVYGAFAAEMVLSPMISVTVPEGQSGNPGEFITYILQLTNRDAKPLILEVEYISGRGFNVLGEVSVSLPPHSTNRYFPVTVQIPPNAPAGLAEQIRVRFKLHGASFALPEVILEAQVNPVSAIHFTTPASGAGIPGSQVPYEITISNTGNTAEDLRIEYHSANDWPVKVDPIAFSLSPGHIQIIRIIHAIPGYPGTDRDDLELIFKWGPHQKSIYLTTRVADKLEELRAEYFIWQGELRLGQSDQTFSGELALNGEFGPSQRASLYASEETWFANLQSKGWDLKTGQFPLSWPGLFTPLTDQANLFLSRGDAERNLTISNWSAASASQDDIWGVEATLNRQSRLRWLHAPAPDYTANLLEWHYQNSLTPALLWSNALSINASDQTNIGGEFTLAGQAKSWQWNTQFQYFQNFRDILKKQRLAATIGRPPVAASAPSGYLQLQYEGKQLLENAQQITAYDDYQWQVTANLFPGLRVYLAQSYHWINAVFDRDNFSGGLSLSRQSGPFSHEANLSFSRDNDHSEDPASYYWLDWILRYPSSPRQTWIINPNFDSDYSRIGLGYHRRLAFGAEMTTLFYPYFHPDDYYKWTFNLSWPFTGYWLVFHYTGVWQSGAYHTDSYILSLNRRFSFPVKKPLGILTGMAFIDSNGNGIHEPHEILVGGLDLLLDETTPFRSDEKGWFSLSGLTPGEHHLTLDSRYNVIYSLPESALRITTKAYQNVTVNLPLIRSRNLVGRVFEAKNISASPPRGIAGVSLILTNLENGEIQRAYTDNQGEFVFYQLAPATYELGVETTVLPEAWQLPPDFQSLVINAATLETQERVEIGLIPYQKPIDLILLPASSLNLTLDRAFAYRGETVKITVSGFKTLNQVNLLLPDGSELHPDPAVLTQGDWRLQWRIPQNLVPGPYAIRCSAVASSGEALEAEWVLTIL